MAYGIGMQNPKSKLLISRSAQERNAKPKAKGKAKTPKPNPKLPGWPKKVDRFGVVIGEL